MTLRERLIATGRALSGKPDVIKEIKSEVEKSVGGFFVDYFKDNNLTSDTRISSKVLQANKGWVYRNTDVIAKEVAGIEFELFTTRIVGNEIELRPITTHPVLDLLDKFNQFTDAGSGFYTTESHRLLAGNCYWYLAGKPNPTDIYILPPDKIDIEPKKIEAGQVVIDKFKYQDTIRGKRITEEYMPEEIIHHKIPNPNSYFLGLGKVKVAADDIDTDWMAIEANKKLFQRGLIGNFVLTQEKSLTEEQRKQLRAELTASYAGLQNAFKIPILSGGLKPENIQMTNKDMEFIKQQEWVRDKISSIWGNPKSLITTDDVNRANAEATLLNWKQTTVRQEMKQICDTLNEFLVPKFGKGLILGFKDPVPEDDAKNDNRATTLKSGGIITRNEARELAGYEGVEGGDDFPEPFNPLKPDSEVPKSLKYVSYHKHFRKMGHYKQIDDFMKLKKAARPLAKELVKKRKEQRSKSMPVNIKTYYDKQIQIVEVAEKILQNRIQKFIEKLVRKGLLEVPSEIKEVQAKQLFVEEDEIVQATLDFYPILETLAQSAGDNAMDLIKYGNPYVMTAYRQKIKERIQLFTKSMVETDRDKLIDIITEGVRNGEGVPQIRQNITEFFKDYSKSQAERITRTEVLRVSNQAALDAWEQSGVVEGKEWLTAPGADAECEQYNGKKIFDLQGNFFPIESEFDDGDPPKHPNCRCVVLPIVGEKSFDSTKLQISGLKSMVRKLESELEGMDKRTKDYKQKLAEKDGYIKELEDYLDS